MTGWPLRRTLLLGTVALTVLALTVAGVTSALALRSYLIERTDEQLKVAAGVAQQRAALLKGTDLADAAIRAAIAPSEYVVELRRDDGALSRFSGPDSLPVGVLVALAPTAPADGRISPPATVHSGQYRVVSVRASDATVVVGLPMAPVRQTVARLVLVEVIGGGLVLALLVGFACPLLVRSMRPLQEITATATAIAQGDLDRRVPVDERTAGTEVGRLTLAVNGMLGHIQTALAARARSEQRMRHFVADASHELRTPLTSIRGYLQLLRKGIVTVEGRPDVLRRADDEASRMAAIVDDLLYLARLDARLEARLDAGLDAEPGRKSEPFDLVVVIRDSVADALAVQPGRPTTLDVPECCPVRGDEDALRQVMANLLANVREHTPPAAAVTVRLTKEDGHARVAVTDRGPGMPADIAERAFDRFVRADTSRGGSGLGLAIVAQIVAAHGGRVHLDSAPGLGTTAVFTIPTADS
jgi:two-component system OmpR family sensor kinase